MVRMRNRPLSVSIGKIKEIKREMNFLPAGRKSRCSKGAEQNFSKIRSRRKNFESELKIIYAATLLSREIRQEFIVL